jgi:hypothetical protein
MATDKDAEWRSKCIASMVPLNPPPMIKTSDCDSLTGEDLFLNA